MLGMNNRLFSLYDVNRLSELHLYTERSLSLHTCALISRLYVDEEEVAWDKVLTAGDAGG